MENIKVFIRKPLYGNFCYIREKYINEAIKNKVMLDIELPQGSALVNPLEWKETGKLMLKEFKIKGFPMRLWGNNVPLK